MIAKTAFYILNNESSLKGCAIYTCRIIEKAYSNNRKIYIHTTNLEAAQNFDIQLWTFSDISFVPHEIYTQNSNLDVQILIGYGNNLPEKKDILVNLTPEIMPFYQQFNHLIEVVPNDDNLKSLARKRFQTYQKDSCPIEIFNI